MKYAEVIDNVAEQTGLTKKDVKSVIDTLSDTITTSLASGDSVVLSGLGTFRSVHREARQGRNPYSGETIQIAAKNAPKFKASSVLKNAMNS